MWALKRIKGMKLTSQYSCSGNTIQKFSSKSAKGLKIYITRSFPYVPEIKRPLQWIKFHETHINTSLMWVLYIKLHKNPVDVNDIRGFIQKFPDSVDNEQQK
jgi:hypothetical protein